MLWALPNLQHGTTIWPSRSQEDFCISSRVLLVETPCSRHSLPLSLQPAQDAPAMLMGHYCTGPSSLASRTTTTHAEVCR